MLVGTVSPILPAYSVSSEVDGSLAKTAAAVLAFPVAGGVCNVDAAEAVAESARADCAGGAVKRRESEDLPPGRLRLASPYDTDARYGLKQGSWWTGYKIHVSESCDETDDQDAATGQAMIPGADGPRRA